MLLKVLWAYTLVWVRHGPVQCTDEKLIIESEQDLPALRASEPVNDIETPLFMI